MRRRWILISLFLLLIIGGGALCAIRWQAWFGNPAEPQWTADTLDYHFYTFAADSLPGFVQTKDGWQDTQSPDTLRIMLLGDVHNSLSRADYDTLAARNPHLDCYAQLGDYIERGYFYYFQQLYHELSGSAFDSLPVLSCPGNHEYHKGFAVLLHLFGMRPSRNLPTVLQTLSVLLIMSIFHACALLSLIPTDCKSFTISRASIRG